MMGGAHHQRRAAVIRPLAAAERAGRVGVSAAAAELGLSARHVYTLIRRCWAAEGALTSMLPSRPSGGRGNARLAKEVESLLCQVIDAVYLTKQRPSGEVVVQEIRRRCAAAGIAPPSPSTIRRRLRGLAAAERRKRGEAQPSARPVVGATPQAPHPLAVLQMDHTVADVILVDPVDRQPIGRPYLTLAIDVFSRCIAGFHLSLEPPSATSVGLCLTHVAMAKAPWLELRGIDAAWPLHGKPERIAVDNAREFKSAAFERGCAQHGIAIDYRPPGQPHYGGVVERVIGTLMRLAHILPGTTFADIEERGRYPSAAKACLTLEELERWLAVAICQHYHQRLHEGLGEPPLARLEAGWRTLEAQGRSPRALADPAGFLIDFLPVHRRTLQRHGFVLDHITYWSPALKPWLAGGRRSRCFLIRRDPRDLSRIWVQEPEAAGYLEVPCRVLSRPSISLLDHRLALRRLRAQGRRAIDETALFAAIEAMRGIVDRASAATRQARQRQRERLRRSRSEVVQPAAPPPPFEAITTTDPAVPPVPFEEIERW
jgi:putative transposase